MKLSPWEIAAVLGYAAVLAFCLWPRARVEEVWRDKPWPKSEDGDA